MATSTLLRSSLQTLKRAIPWLQHPLIIGAPMRGITSPSLALAVTSAGGFGFINVSPDTLDAELSSTAETIASSVHLSSLSSQTSPPGRLPIGAGFLTWCGQLDLVVRAIEKNPPVAVWLFAPTEGQKELDEWSAALRKAAPGVLVFLQIASVAEALEASASEHAPDVLVVQGSDAGGHSRVRGASIVTLLPEVADVLEGSKLAGIPLVAAGGITESRGVAAALALGASGVVMGTRLLASNEAKLSEGYRKHVVAASDGGQKTVRTLVYNHVRGIYGWPDGFEPRALMNKTWEDYAAGVEFEEVKNRFVELSEKGEEAWGEKGRQAAYAGTGVGLIKSVQSAGDIVKEVRDGVTKALESAITVKD